MLLRWFGWAQKQQSFANRQKNSRHPVARVYLDNSWQRFWKHVIVSLK